MNVALHKAITIRIKIFETNQNGRHAGRFSPSTLQMKTLNISGVYSAKFFIFSTNVALYWAIIILTLIMKKSKWLPCGPIFSVIPHKKSVNISEPVTWIDFIFGTNVALHRAINIFSKNY